MPDISMCASETCPLRTLCYRNPAGGTRPSEYRQAWFLNTDEWGEDCRYFLPVYGKREDRK
jgi:hypothetical protein